MPPEFLFSPSWTPMSQRKPRLLTTKFGDGYEQRGGDGINTDLYSWELTFMHLPPGEAEAIEQFFVKHNTAVSPFLWTPPRPTTRTNLLTFSDQFDNAAWVKTRSNVTANAVTAPDGTLTADKLYSDATASSTHYAFQDNVAGVTAGSAITLSVYAKAAEYSHLRLYVTSADGTTGGFRAEFNLITGVATAVANVGVGTRKSYSIASVGNGWYRCSVTGIVSTTDTTIDAQILLLSAPDTESYTGNGVSGVYLWGAHLDAAIAKFICRSWTRAMTSPLTDQLTATFEEVADP